VEIFKSQIISQVKKNTKKPLRKKFDLFFCVFQRPKFQTLLSTSHWSPTIEVCSMLSDLCLEQDLELNYTYLGRGHLKIALIFFISVELEFFSDKIDGANNVLCIAQVSSLIYPGVGEGKLKKRMYINLTINS